MNLNQEQKKAIQKIDKNILVIASAGTGKTSVLVERYLYILEKKRISIKKILAITFTDKAAIEMKNRILERLIERINTAKTEKEKSYWHKVKKNFIYNQISTIHSFCSKIIRQYALVLNINPSFEIIEDFYVLEEFKSHIKETLYNWAIYSHNNFENPEDPLKKTIQYYEEIIDAFDFKTIEEIFLTFFSKPYIFNQQIKRLDQRDFNYYSNFIQGSLKKEFFKKLEKFFEKYETKSLFDELIENSIDLEKYLKKTTSFFKFLIAFNHFLKSLKKIKDKEISIQILKDKYIEFRETCSKNISDYYQDTWKKETGHLFFLFFEQFEWIFPRVFFEILFIPNENILSTNFKWISKFIHLFKAIKKNILLKDKDNLLLEWYNKNKLTFNDLQSLAHKLFLKKHYQKQILDTYQYLMVDEFQDLDIIQQELLKVFLSKNHTFFVGDFKQSIYKFRGSNIGFLNQFMENIPKDNFLKISLVKNYRSSIPIIQFINQYFSKLMKYAYENFETIYQFIESSEISISKNMDMIQDQFPIEILFSTNSTDIENTGENIAIEEDQNEVEVEDIAKRILDLIKNQNIQFRDISILFFKAKNYIHLYEKIFLKYQIPCQRVYETSFSEIQEIQDCFYLLKFLNQEENDEYALSVLLRSPFCGISDKTLYKLVHETKVNRAKPFKHRRILDAYKSNDFDILEDIEKKKLSNFKKLIQDLKKNIYKLSISEILKLALKKSFYLDLIHALDNKEKYEILDFFIATIEDIEQKNSLLYLSDFILFFDKMQNFLKVKTLNQSDENKVKLMTIHKSKGMEFKIVIIPNLLHNFLSIHSIEGKIYHSFLGFVFDSNIENKEEENPYIEFLKNLNKQEDISEFRRLLYVAMTRAKNKIIFSSLIKERTLNQKQFDQNFLHHTKKNLNALYYLIKILDIFDPIKKLFSDLNKNDRVIFYDSIPIKIYKNYRFLEEKSEKKGL